MNMIRPVLLAAVGLWSAQVAAQSPEAGAPLSSAPQPLPQVNVVPPPSGQALAPVFQDGAVPKVGSGLLECRGEFATGTGFGSTRRVRCEYRSTNGRNHYYVGTLERSGLDIGISDQGSMLWGVLASSPTLEKGALAGTYVGFSSGFALGPGFSANVLASKDASRQVTLQPVSISSDSGLSLSITGVTLILEPSTAAEAGDAPPARR